MAADSKTRTDRPGTLSFTLPISCQICLGKVKQPVLCPNNHVFCSCCMDVWLQRNQQCPACRVDINPGNPIKHIRGGINHNEDDNMNERLTNPQMRRARLELLYKEYEDEFERLDGEIHILKTENEVLKAQLHKDTSKPIQNGGHFTHPDSVDSSHVLALTRKLQDSHKQFERVKAEYNRYKQENNKLKDENINMNRENERLRVEIGNRSPYRYGRLTVATLESKIESYEKEIKQLNKALERSDTYVEDLERELQSYGHKRNTEKPKLIKDYNDFNNTSVSDSKSQIELSKRRLFSDADSDFSEKSRFDKTDPVQFAKDLYKSSAKSVNSENDAISSTKTYRDKEHVNPSITMDQKMWKSNLTGISSCPKDKTPKKVKFDVANGDSTNSSFDLERPSPLTPSTSMGRLTLSDTNPSSAKKHLNFEDNLSRHAPSVKQDGRPYVNYGSQGASMTTTDELVKPTGDGEMSLDDTGVIKSELDDLDISMTPELNDCMKLLNRAEKKMNVNNKANATNHVYNEGTRQNRMGSISHYDTNYLQTVTTNLPVTSTFSTVTESKNNYLQPGNVFLDRPRSAPILSQAMNLETMDYHLPSSKHQPFTNHRESESTNPSPLRSKMSSSTSRLNENSEMNHNLPSVGLSEMVKRGQNILKSLDHKPLTHDTHRSSSALPFSSDTPHYSLPLSSNQLNSFHTATSVSSHSKSHSTTSSCHESLARNRNHSNESLHAPRKNSPHPNYRSEIAHLNENTTTLPSFDIPESLIIHSPNLSSDFTLGDQNKATNFNPSSQNMSKSNQLPPKFPPADFTNSSHYFSTAGATGSLSMPQRFSQASSSSGQPVLSNTPFFPVDHQPSSLSLPKPAAISSKPAVHRGDNSSYAVHRGDNSSSAVHRGGNSSPPPLCLSVTENGESFRLDAPSGNFSLASNDLSSRASDSFLTEPKKRLYETDEDFNLSMSPIKTSRHY